jgi:uncharacterized membrane protein YcaP (DUF421 family)
MFLIQGFQSILQRMFGLPGDFANSQQEIICIILFVMEKSLRPLVVYLSLAVLLRWFGKRVLAQLNPFDLVVYLSLANIVQNALIGNDDSVTGGLIGAVALLLINYFVVRFVFKHKLLEKFFESEPTVLIENGRVQNNNLARQHLTQSELLTAAHRQGFASLNEIERCELDAGGAFFIEGKPEKHADVEKTLSGIIERLERLSLQVAELKRQ